MSLRFPLMWRDLLADKGETGETGGECSRYSCLHRSLLVTMLLITLIPLLLTTMLSFSQYRQLLEKETQNNARWHGESIRHSLEAFLDKLKNAMVVTANSHPVEEFASQTTLSRIFTELKNEHRGLVDLSLIGPDGIQSSYVGPYNLVGKSYIESSWYIRALARKVLVSDVFTGYRNVPHFVIAVTVRAPDSNDYWVLRASIDTRTLEDFFASVSSEQIDDLFLINQEGDLQTTSRYYGSVGDRFRLAARPGRKDFDLVSERRGGDKVLRAAGMVSGTPWTLVLEQKDYDARKGWFSFRNQLVAIFALTVLAAGVIIVRIAAVLTSRIREAEEEREYLFKNQEHTNKLASIGRLAAGVAHEINNPLAIINEKAGLLKDILQLNRDFPQREKFLGQLGGLENAVERARTITHRLLGFARRMDVSLQQLQVNEVIQEVLGFLHKEASYRGIELHLDLDADLPAIESDQGQLQQILLNIFNNAIDAIDKEGEIRISTHRITAERIQIDIADNGPGIPQKVLPHIFEPFFSTKLGKDRHGTGLGLSITYGLVVKLGGEIYVASEEGTGTTFSLVFPINPRKSGI
ncbi:MAG: ATP-binding protein [Thermodesulfobacteriota bacterium]